MKFLQLIISVVVIYVEASPAANNGTIGHCPPQCKCQNVASTRSALILRSVDCTFASPSPALALPLNLSNDTESLVLRGNNLREVPPLLPTELKELDLSGNRIKMLGRISAFGNSTNLTHLTMAKNQLSALFAGTLQGLLHLQWLSVAENKINYIEEGALSSLPSLVSLDLSHNLLGSLYADWFRSLPKLTTLSIAHNRIHHLPSKTFKGAPAIRALDLSGNRLAAVDTEAFVGLENLETLRLEDNLLASVPSGAFNPLSDSLRLLRLDGNPIDVLGTKSFAGLKALFVLRLDRLTELRFIEAKAFFQLAHLQELHLENNSKLMYVDPLALSGLPSLRRLLLHNCALHALNSLTAASLPPKCILSLHGNPLQCDCNVRWLHSVLQNEANNSTLIVDEPEHITCAEPLKSKHKLVRDLAAALLPKRCSPTVLDLTTSTQFVPDGPTLVERRLGDSLSLECRALGVPEPTLLWNFPHPANESGSPSNNNNVRMKLTAPGSLSFLHVASTDAGIYSCRGENAVGRTEIQWQLKVLRLDLHLFASASSANFVTLVWNGTQRYAFPRYELRYLPMSNAKSMEEDGDDNDSSSGGGRALVSPFRRSYTVAHLLPDTKYRFCLAFHNRHEGVALTLACTEAKTQDPSFLAQGISRPPAAAAALATALIATACLAAAVGCTLTALSRRRRRRLYEVPPSSSSGGPNGKSSSEVSSLSNNAIPMDSLRSPLIGDS